MSALGFATVILPGVVVALFVAYVLDAPLADCTSFGARGLARQKARRSQLFRVIEPALRLLATHIADYPIGNTRRRLEDSISAAGEFHGLNANEVVALSVVTGLFGLLLGYCSWSVTESYVLTLGCPLVGPLLPAIRLASLAKVRHKSVDRGLPVAIDLAALCMGAGLDFPSAISHVVENMPDRSSPIRQELERILQELSLGRTRRQALTSFSDRVRTEAVGEFVAAVVQAEEKGTPLSIVLSIQAKSLRGRRSVLAEEAAARAGVMLMLPMLMMMGSISLILMGPLVIDMMRGGLM